MPISPRQPPSARDAFRRGADNAGWRETSVPRPAAYPRRGAAACRAGCRCRRLFGSLGHPSSASASFARPSLHSRYCRGMRPSTRNMIGGCTPGRLCFLSHGNRAQACICGFPHIYDNFARETDDGRTPQAVASERDSGPGAFCRRASLPGDPARARWPKPTSACAGATLLPHGVSGAGSGGQESIDTCGREGPVEFRVCARAGRQGNYA